MSISKQCPAEVGTINVTLTSTNAKIDATNTKLDAVNANLDSVETKLDTIDDSLVLIESAVDDLKPSLKTETYILDGDTSATATASTTAANGVVTTGDTGDTMTIAGGWRKIAIAHQNESSEAGITVDDIEYNIVKVNGVAFVNIPPFGGDGGVYPEGKVISVDPGVKAIVVVTRDV